MKLAKMLSNGQKRMPKIKYSTNINKFVFNIDIYNG